MVEKDISKGITELTLLKKVRRSSSWSLNRIHSLNRTRSSSRTYSSTCTRSMNYTQSSQSILPLANLENESS